MRREDPSQRAWRSDKVRLVAPALNGYTEKWLRSDLWERPELDQRDRSIVTLSALIARNQTADLPFYVGLALDSGVKPNEISELVTHLAFYCGWSNATAAVSIIGAVFEEHKIGPDQLAQAEPPLLALDEAAEARRAARVGEQIGATTPGLNHYTTEALFLDLWLRPDLAPRDRSLVTVSALLACGQVAQLTPHLNRAMDNGLTQAQAAEIPTHLAFYSGWPNAMSAAPIIKAVFESRATAGGA